MSISNLQPMLESLGPRLRRIGLAGLAFFTLKGLLWLALPFMLRWWWS